MRRSSTMLSLAAPGMELLIKPRMTMTTIRSETPRPPRCTTISRNFASGSSRATPVLTRPRRAIARKTLIITLAQSARNRKSVRQPSLRFAMTRRETGGKVRSEQALFALHSHLVRHQTNYCDDLGRFSAKDATFTWTGTAPEDFGRICKATFEARLRYGFAFNS